MKKTKIFTIYLDGFKIYNRNELKGGVNLDQIRHEGRSVSVKNKKSCMARDGVRLFWMTVPLIGLLFLFCYVPLAGWRYAFFNYKPGLALSQCEFVGLKYFLLPLSNEVTRKEIFRVVKNTMGMSLLGLASSIIPMMFAIFLAELRFNRYRKIIQTVTTLPNFISWVLVYSLAFSMFSVDSGFINNVVRIFQPEFTGINYLASSSHVWLTMWAYGTWKGLGWSAIMYIAALGSIDEALYEAASIDGAGRFQKIWHITIPGLLPTFFVLLLLGIANFLNTGYEQYFIFQNAMNKANIETLDLYVYNQGITGSNISYSTAVGMLKSLIKLFF